MVYSFVMEKETQFNAKVCKMGHKLMINVPTKAQGFKPGTPVTVSSQGVGRKQQQEGKQ